LALLRSLIKAIEDTISSCFLLLNRDLLSLYANAAFFRIWPEARNKLGCPLEELWPREVFRAAPWEKWLREVLETGQPRLNQVVEWESPGQQTQVFRFSLLPLAERGQPLSPHFCVEFVPVECHQVCSVCTANSEFWQGEKVLLLGEDLTQQRRWEQQLLQSEKLAGLGQLVAGIAHELRNPLSSINAAAYYVADALTEANPDLADIPQYLELIQRNVRRAERIITNLMQFARPDRPEPQSVDLNELVSTTLSLLNKSFADSKVELILQRNDIPPARCRPDTVKQALLNIIVNGLQAMPQGGQMTIQTFFAPERGMSCIAVTDTGIGIPPEHLSAIFQPFFTTKAPYEGTGLGLSIALMAVEADGGHIFVESEPGRGSTFTIELPRA